MLFQFIVLYVFTCFHYCYGKSPFRSCSEENPCDKHFFCDNFSMFCISCSDICDQKFSSLCGIYCADSEFINNIEVSPSGSQIETKNASSIGSTTVVIGHINVNIIGISNEHGHFRNVQVVVLAILVLLVALAAVLSTLFMYIRGSDQKHCRSSVVAQWQKSTEKSHAGVCLLDLLPQTMKRLT